MTFKLNLHKYLAVTSFLVNVLLFSFCELFNIHNIFLFKGLAYISIFFYLLISWLVNFANLIAILKFSTNLFEVSPAAKKISVIYKLTHLIFRTSFQYIIKQENIRLVRCLLILLSRVDLIIQRSSIENPYVIQRLVF